MLLELAFMHVLVGWCRVCSSLLQPVPTKQPVMLHPVAHVLALFFDSHVLDCATHDLSLYSLILQSDLAQPFALTGTLLDRRGANSPRLLRQTKGEFFTCSPMPVDHISCLHDSVQHLSRRKEQKRQFWIQRQQVACAKPHTTSSVV